MILIETQPFALRFAFDKGRWNAVTVQPAPAGPPYDATNVPEIAHLLNFAEVSSRSTPSEVGLDALACLQDMGVITGGTVIQTEPPPGPPVTFSKDESMKQPFTAETLKPFGLTDADLNLLRHGWTREKIVKFTSILSPGLQAFFDHVGKMEFAVPNEVAPAATPPAPPNGSTAAPALPTVRDQGDEPPAPKDWNLATRHEFTRAEAQEIGEMFGVDWEDVDLDEFQQGLVVELEHARPPFDVVENDIKRLVYIALAHLAERPDYYTVLTHVEGSMEFGLNDLVDPIQIPDPPMTHLRPDNYPPPTSEHRVVPPALVMVPPQPLIEEARGLARRAKQRFVDNAGVQANIARAAQAVRLTFASAPTDGHWVTTESDNHLLIKDGQVAAGNPHVLQHIKEKGGKIHPDAKAPAPAVKPAETTQKPAAKPDTKPKPAHEKARRVGRMAGLGRMSGGGLFHKKKAKKKGQHGGEGAEK